MTRFTLRSALVLAVVLLLAGATTSFAQFGAGQVVTFTASAGNPQVRIGGITEAIGDQTLTAGLVAGAPAVLSVVAGGTPSFATLTFTYNAPITNKTLSSGVAVACAAGNFTGIAAAGITVTLANIACPGTTVQWTASGSTLTIVFNVGAGGSITFGVGAVGATVTVHGARLNAASLGVPPSVQTLTVFVNTSPTANVQLLAGSQQLTVGTLANGLGSVSRLGNSTTDKFISIPGGVITSTFTAPIAKCAAPELCNKTADVLPRASLTNCGIRGIPQGGAAGSNLIITATTPAGTGTIDTGGNANFGVTGTANAIGLKIVEGYPGALTTKAQEVSKSAVGEVDNGTRVQITFSAVPSQVVIAAAEQVNATENTVGINNVASGLTMDLVGANTCVPTFCGVLNQAIANVRGNSGGTIVFEYEVVGNVGPTTGIASSIILPFWLYRTSTPTDLGTINISVRLSPINGPTIVRFSDTQSALTATVAINACATDLFYPFVTNVAGFDTGIYVVNGGQGNSNANGTYNTNESGACVARFFDGSTTGTTAVKTSTLPALGPGQSFSFTVSDASLGKAGFGNGYLLMTCPFEHAHGAAYVTFAFGTAPIGSAPPGTIYLALVGDSQGATSGR